MSKIKINSFYFIGMVFVLVGLLIKIPSFYLQIDYLFQVGLGFSGIGILLLAILIVKNRGWNFVNPK